MGSTGDVGQRARLIPVAGISGAKEAEQRATSALLAVLSIARDLSVELLSPMGASKALKATVECFTEVSYTVDGKTVRPDGLIRVTFGKSSPWIALVEVKTGEDTLNADQVNAYWDLARSKKFGEFNHVITISNEIPAVSGAHPTEGLRVQRRSPVQVSHLSWTAILTTAQRIIHHRGVDDPEQAWILSELIRYLEHPKSGVVSFDDMGPDWTTVRGLAQSSTLTTKTDGVRSVASKFDTLLRFAALQLASQIGEDVTPVLSRAHRDPKARLNHLVDVLVRDGRLDGVLRVPNTAGDIEITADLKAQQITVAMTVDAPDDRGDRGRVSWLVNQLPTEADRTITLETFAKNARTPVTAPLAAVREDRGAALGPDRIDPYRFRLVQRAVMSTARKPTARQAGFVGSVLNLIASFYDDVVQEVTPWQPKAPKRRPPVEEDEPAEATEHSDET